VRQSDDIKWIEPIALVCADSFLKTAQSFIDIKRINSDLPEGPIGAYGPAFGDLAVCATNLAFALEIYLKCLRAQLGLGQARGHDLWELYCGLPSDIKSEIESRYERGRTNPSPAYAYISFALTQRPDKPIWQDLGLASMNLEDVLKRSKDVFVSWRYVFEFRNAEDKNSHQVHTFEYLLLLLGCVAINEAILRNWYTPRLGVDPNAPRPWMVLNESDFAKVSSTNLWENAMITDQYTGKRYRVRNVDGDQIVEEAS
jgi:hypothetical protein